MAKNWLPIGLRTRRGRSSAGVQRQGVRPLPSATGNARPAKARDRQLRAGGGEDAGHFDAARRLAAAKTPFRLKMGVGAEHQTAISGEIFRAQRRPAPRKVIGTGDDDAAAVEQTGARSRSSRPPVRRESRHRIRRRRCRRSGRRAYEMDRNLRVAPGEAGDGRRNPTPADRHRRGDPERAARRGGGTDEAALEFLEVGGDATGPIVIGLPPRSANGAGSCGPAMARRGASRGRRPGRRPRKARARDVARRRRTRRDGRPR